MLTGGEIHHDCVSGTDMCWTITEWNATKLLNNVAENISIKRCNQKSIIKNDVTFHVTETLSQMNARSQAKILYNPAPYINQNS